MYHEVGSSNSWPNSIIRDLNDSTMSEFFGDDREPRPIVLIRMRPDSSFMKDSQICVILHYHNNHM